MLNGLSKTLLKYPVPVMTVIMFITGLFFWIAFFSDNRLQVDFSLEQMFPENDPEKDAYDSFIEEKIKAKFKDGVLNIIIPKADEVKPSVKQIAVS